MKTSKLLTFAIVAFLVACDDGATVTIRNRSPHDLTNVVLVGSCFRTPVRNVKAGKSESYLVQPSCESGLGLEFAAAGRLVRSPIDGYFEGSPNYIVNAEVSPELKVTVETDLAFSLDLTPKAAPPN